MVISVIDPNPSRHYQSPVTNLRDLTTSQLRGIIAIKEQIEALQGQIDSIVAGGGSREISMPFSAAAPVPAKRKLSAAHRRKLTKALAKARRIRLAKIKGTAKKGKRRLSAAGRAAIAAGARARWASVKGTTATPKPAKKRRTVSPEVRAKLAAAAKARWAKVRAEGKTTL
jgi:hypothetical protein